MEFYLTDYLLDNGLCFRSCLFPTQVIKFFAEILNGIENFVNFININHWEKFNFYI